MIAILWSRKPILNAEGPIETYNLGNKRQLTSVQYQRLLLLAHIKGYELEFLDSDAVAADFGYLFER